jgi:hypothetical protein
MKQDIAKPSGTHMHNPYQADHGCELGCKGEELCVGFRMLMYKDPRPACLLSLPCASAATGLLSEPCSKLHNSPSGEDVWDVGRQLSILLPIFHFQSQLSILWANFPFCCQFSVLCADLLQAAAGQRHCRHVHDEGEDVWDANFPFCCQLFIL